MKLGARGLIAVAAATFACAGAAAESRPPEEQISAAVLAAPEDRREEARVLGYDPAGVLVELREGTNDLVCIADKPGDETFSVACYHASLEPYMRRGRELAAEGISGEERMKRRWQEAEEGTLAMPDKPATLYVLSGSAYDATTGSVTDSYLRWVVYTPWATPESTGLPLNPQAPGAPWLMFPGTAGAHIMITPPKPAAEPAVDGGE